MLLQPAKAAAGVVNGLPVGLERKADVGPDELIGALMTFRHPAIVVWEAQAEDRNADALEPFAQPSLAVPFSVPIGEKDHCRHRLSSVPGRGGRF